MKFSNKVKKGLGFSKKIQRRIILDTNFLLIPFQFRVDIFEEVKKIADFKYKLFVLDKTLDELVKIQKEQKGKNRAAAKLALQLIKKKDVKIIKTTEDKIVDDLLAQYSRKGDIIATQDLGLKRRLKKPYIILRQKKYLALT